MPSRRRHLPGRDPGSQRSSRLGELLREIIADELSRIDDERLEWVSVTHVKTDRSLDRAIVYFTAALGSDEDEAALVDVFDGHRSRLQAAVGRQTRLRRTPPLEFRPDSQLRSAERIEDILRGTPAGGSAGDDVRGSPAGGSAGDDVRGSRPEVPSEEGGSAGDDVRGSRPEVPSEEE